MICFKGISREFFSENPQSETRPHSSPDPSCGREISRGRANPKPQKNSLPCRVRIVSVSFVGIFCKMGSDFFKQTPPNQKLVRQTADEFLIWWTIADLNRLPLPCHGSALPSELMAHSHYLYFPLLTCSTCTSIS